MQGNYCIYIYKLYIIYISIIMCVGVVGDVGVCVGMGVWGV